MGRKKYYVVWNGVSPGIYTSWTDCQLQINGYEGAIYKSFDTVEEAEKAYHSSPYLYIKKRKLNLIQQISPSWLHRAIGPILYCLYP